MARGEARDRLLERAIGHISQRGLSDLSLRELAAAIGTSHRMLIHHFGSKEGLWVEVIRTVEARQRELMPDIAAAVVEDPAQATRAWWRHISDPSLWPNERLFFELYGPTAGCHARTAVGMAALPRGIAVEVNGEFEIA